MSLIPSMLFGMLVGFIILDERDEDIISYISVTPVGRKGYFLYKIFISSFASFIFFYITVYATNLAGLPFIYSVPLALMVALEAPFASFFLAVYSENKVEGLAMGKILGIMYVAPFAAYFVKSDLQYIAGVLPPFWIAKAFFSIPDNSYAYISYVLIGIIVHAVFLAFIVKKFLGQQK
jgi:fluoroquinolone transport system permease protein